MTGDKPTDVEPLPPTTPSYTKSQFDYYDKGSTKHFRKYVRLKTLQVIAGAAIPLAAVVIPEGRELVLRSLAATLGAIVAVIETILQFRKYQENWIRWRDAAEELRTEAFLFSQKAGAYGTAPNPETLIIERTAAITSAERRSWRTSEQDKGKAGPTTSPAPPVVHG